MELSNKRLTTASDSLERTWLKRSAIILVAVMSIYGSVALWAGRGGWGVTLAVISVRDIFILIGLVLVGFLLRAGRWHYYIRVLHWEVPLLHSITAFVASIALTVTPAKSGELAKVVLLRSQHEISLSQGAGVLLIERLGDLFAVVVITIGGLTLFIDLSRYVLVSVILLCAALFVAATSRVVLVRAQAIPKLRALSSKLLNILNAVQQLLRPLPLLIGVSIALAAWSCEALAFHFLVSRLNIHNSILVSFSIYGLSTLAGALSMLPGGLGGVEAVMAFLLTRLAIPASVAAIVVVVFRLCTLWLFSFIGLIFMLAWIIFLSKRGGANLAVETR
jgi:uncharacterized protein (TIRG00374 family)